MQTIKKIISWVLMGLGFLFLCQIIFLAYLWIVDPLNLKPLFFSNNPIPANVVDVNGEVDDSSANPLISDTQADALAEVGVDADTLPSSITTEQEACFVEILGQARVDAIKAGSSPTATEFFRASGCL